MIVEQKVMEGLEISDRGYVIEHGKLVKEGAAAQLIADPSIREAYLGSVSRRHSRSGISWTVQPEGSPRVASSQSPRMITLLFSPAFQAASWAQIDSRDRAESGPNGRLPASKRATRSRDPRTSRRRS